MSPGVLAAILSFVLWGVVPIYWKQLEGIPAVELIAHRICWSVLLLLVVIAWRKSFARLWPAFSDARIFGTTLAASLLLAGNWGLYVVAVNSDHVIDASLGYFLTPLCSVVLGFSLLRERLRTPQWVSVGFAAAGVALLVLHSGAVPWIAIGIGVTWALYGILKKKSRLGPISGLTFEALLLLPFAVALLAWKMTHGVGVLGHASVRVHAYLLGLALVTTVPLLLFAYGAQRIRLVTLGLLQYISPTLQFLIGLYLYHEPFDAARFQACLLIWLGLVIYTADGFWTHYRRPVAPVSAAGV